MAQRRRLRETTLGVVVVMLLVAAPAASAAWSKTLPAQRAAAKFGTWASCSAGSATFQATADGEIYGDNATHSAQMTGSTMAAQSTTSQSSRRRVFVLFGGFAVPSGCTVTSATLTLWNGSASVGSSGNEERVGQVATAWSESSKPLYGVGIVGTEVVYARCSVPCARPIDVTTFATSWASGTLNAGVRVTFTNDANSTSKTDTFDTRESTTSAHRPTLQVNWGP